MFGANSPLRGLKSQIDYDRENLEFYIESSTVTVRHCLVSPKVIWGE